MPESQDSPETILTLIRGAAEGRPEDRSRFCRRYLPLVRACFSARWRGSSWVENLDDAVQEVFLECLRERGALDTFDADQPKGFRAFLYGVIRNVARRFEQSRGRRAAREQPLDNRHLDDLESREQPLSRFFEREWARSIMQQAGEAMHARAMLEGEAALQRFELLRLRFQDGLPVRDIAARWQQDPAAVHRAYRKAREEFRVGLEEVVAYHRTGSKAWIAQECERLLESLGD